MDARLSVLNSDRRHEGRAQRRVFCAAFLSCWMVLGSCISLAGPSIPGFYQGTSAATPAANALPSVRDLQQGVSAIVKEADKNRLVIYQNQEKAIINWNSFNIGKDASTHFDQQKNTDWAVLNRIYDSDPSQITGQLTADGKVYLINRNGILFGPGSQVQVHSLLASALNISDADFLRSTLKFRLEDYAGNSSGASGRGAVSNHGTIAAGDLGSAFLLGPNVENAGTITTTGGQIGLVAASETELSADTSGARVALVVNAKGNLGSAVNLETGRLIANTGMVGMYGKNVYQNGLIRAITAIKKNGQIELHASDQVTTGVGSVTECPISESDEKVHESYDFSGGEIRIRGLDPDSPANPQVAVKRIEHYGTISAPSGTVNMEAQDRIYLESGSLIDVSGSWIDKPASSLQISTQLNSNELRDSYTQKYGMLLGATVSFNALYGSSIGDVSGSLSSQEKTALERSLAGGKVYLTVNNGDIITKEGSTIAFSGGGIRYAGGTTAITRLVSGNQVYDLGNAPESLQYDKVLGYQKVHSRYGITDNYAGAYYGGAYAASDLSPGIVEGANAGQLTLSAKSLRLDGDLDGSVTSGYYQTQSEESQNTAGNQATRGLVEPAGGTLIIGRESSSSSSESVDFLVEEVELLADVAALPASFTATDQPYDATSAGKTLLSSKRLSQAGLGSLRIYANTVFATAADSVLSLDPGASFSATARRVEHRGAIQIAGGEISLSTRDNITGYEQLDGLSNARYTPLQERIYLAAGSVLSTAGECIDTLSGSLGVEHPAGTGHLEGGTISLRDETEHGDGVIVKQAATMDVSGGYRIDAKGTVTGGDAGTLEIQGAGIVLEGTLRGYSLVGNDGGTIVLHADQVTVSPTAPELPADFEVASVLPDSLKGELTLAANRFDRTGFAQIELKSVNDLVIESGVQLSPSRVKLAQPTAWNASLASVVYNDFGQPGDTSTRDGGLLTGMAMEWLGSTAIKAEAGVLFESAPIDAVANDNARLTVAADAHLCVAPGGQVTLEAPHLDFGGTISAASGTVALKATLHDLVLSSTSRIEAEGFNQPDVTALVHGVATGCTPLSGGTVTLEADDGNLVLEQGALVSVSGSDPVSTLLRTSGGGLSRVKEAGDAGSVLLSFSGQLRLAGELQGHAGMAGQQGGSLTISKKSVDDGLTISGAEIDRFVASGFDALTLASAKALSFSGAVNQALGRSLTLDAPVIQGSGAAEVSLYAPWITVTNSTFPTDETVTDGLSRITLASEWLDVTGAAQFSGFREVNLRAGHDIRLSDRFYELGTTSLWEGLLETGGDLTCRADRIYPTTLSDFTLRAVGKLTTLPGDGGSDRPIYSAGGKLTVEASGIEHRGFLAAPDGELVLRSTGTQGRVYLAEGSVVSVAGSAGVNYGDVSSLYWTVQDKATLLADNIEAAPARSISLEGDEVIVKEGAEIDISGGGSIFGYEFLAGIEGSSNPLTKAGTYVILPSDPLALPGTAVYLSGISGLAVGVYTLLPAEYAFLPGAMVITDLGRTTSAGQWRTAAGFSVTSGYATTAGTGLHSQGLTAYSVRAAADVLKEGNFNFTELVAGDAGRLTVRGSTTVLDGVIRANFVSGFRGGTIALSGEQIVVKASQTPLPDGFNFASALPDDYTGTLQVAAETLSGKGFQEVDLGNLATTETITIEKESVLEADRITLAATSEIRLGERAQLHGSSASGGEVVVQSPDGKVILERDSLLHAGAAVTLEVGQIELKGAIQIDQGILNLTADRIFLSQTATTPSASGSYLTQDLWNVFGTFADVRLTGRSELVFLSDFDLSAKGKLTLNTGRIAGLDDTGDGVAAVSISSGILKLLNTGSDPGNASLGSVGSLTAQADQIDIGTGSILFDGFGSVSLAAVNDMVLQGSGSLTTGGDLALAAARLVSSGYRDDAGAYQAGSFSIQVENGVLSVTRSAGAAGQNTASGALLEMVAQSIDLSGSIDIGSGQLELTALGQGGESGIFLRKGAEILARGGDHTAGGSVSLNAEEGSLSIARNALIDVSAGGQGDAGLISFYSPTSGLTLEGELRGTAQGGSGGSCVADVGVLDQFSRINRVLAAGGFTGTVAMRARQGDVVVEREDVVRAEQFKLVADGGKIEVAGTIEASTKGEGGRVELYAGDDLNLLASGLIKANASDGDGTGGSVSLSSTGGRLNFAGQIDVSGSGSGSGGSVGFRSAIEGDDMKLDLSGTIVGAASVTAEAVALYVSAGDLAIGDTEIAKWRADLNGFMEGGEAVRARLLKDLQWDRAAGGEFSLLSGLEVQSGGDMTLGVDWDLTSWRDGGASGALTLRAGGDLSINANLVDHPTVLASLPGSSGGDSWTLRLIAGSDLGSADILATQAGKGNLTLADGKMIYTESGSLAFASGADTLLGPSSPSGYMVSQSIRYSLGTYDGDIRGEVGGNLVIRGGAIQSAIGDIDLEIGGNLVLKKAEDYGSAGNSVSLGSIRTTGEPAQGNAGLSNYWDYQNGGDIQLSAGGAVLGNLSNNAWDYAYGTRAPHRWAASYDGTNAAEGLITMGGGNLEVRAGGSFFCQAGSFGEGDLSIQAGGDLKGRFLVKDGVANLATLSNFGSTLEKQVIEAFDAQISVAAQGDIHLGAVVNPTIARAPFTSEWNLRYSADSSLTLVSGTGDVFLYGDSEFYDLGTSQSRLERILPPSLTIIAADSIYLKNEFAMAPSSSGGLKLRAGNDIDGAYTITSLGTTTVKRSSINLSDLDPESVYGYHPGFTVADLFSRYEHADTPVHSDDPEQVSVVAGRDLKNLQLALAKSASIVAGQDILDLYYFGQNLSAEDTTLIQAGRDILFSSSANASYDTGIEHSGPGWLVVRAGGSIDLGTSKGIESVGNSLNPALSSDGSALAISAGFQDAIAATGLVSFFEELREAGLAYSQLQGAGLTEEAQNFIAAVRSELEDSVFGEHAGSWAGELDMTSSQISTAGNASIFLLAKGDLNVGRSSFFSSEEAQKSTGIFTSDGGSINLFAGGDINVNESRVMTFRGGDITAWSHYGDINAGRGSKTAINASPPRSVWVNGVLVVEFDPPAVGSGIRAVTYDPDGVEGSGVAPPAGDIYLFAPQGIIDAGEAGISGGKVILGATEVRNVANISFSTGSVGVPAASEGVASLGALSGLSSLAQELKADSAASVPASRSKLNQGETASEQFAANWLEVKVIGFDTEPEEEESKRN